MSIPDRFIWVSPLPPRETGFNHANLRVIYLGTCLTCILANHSSVKTKGVPVRLPRVRTTGQRTLVSSALHGVDPRNYIWISSQPEIASPQNCQNILVPKLSTDNAAVFSIPAKHPNVAPDSCILHFHATSIIDWCVG